MFIACTKEHFESVIIPRLKQQQEDPKAFLFFQEPEAMTYSKIKGSDGKIEAVLSISGELSNTRYFGTSYKDIVQAVSDAEKDPEVERIVLDINSPGGYVDGVENAGRAIKNAKKETVARVGYLAASGAYWLASQANRIEATSKMATFGSIGVIVSYYDWKEYFEKAGIKEIVITSTDAPNKRLDPATDEGRNEVLNRLDKIHAIFAEAVAVGRKTSIETVNSDFGKGGVLIAEDALKVGMIDKITIGQISKSEDDDMTKIYSQEELDNAVKSATDNLIKHAKFIGKAKAETIVENMKANKPFADCVEQYCEEEFAAKTLEKTKEANPPEGHVSGDKAEEKKEEKEEKAKAEKTIKILDSWEVK